MLVMRLLLAFLMHADQPGEYGRQQNEDESLNESDQQFHEIKGHRQQPAQARHQVAHRFEHVLARENVAEQTETQGHRAEQDREHFQKSDQKEDDNQQKFQRAAGFALRPEQVEKETFDAICLQRPDYPEEKEEHRHGGSHVQVRVAAAQQRAGDLKAVLALHAPADRADARDQAEPVREKNEDEDGREKPEGLFDEVVANDAFQEIVKIFHQTLPEILRAGGDFPHPARGNPREQNQS